MRALLLVAAFAAFAVPASALAQGTPADLSPDACEGANVKDPTLWMGTAITEAIVYVGPGDEYEQHEKKELFQAERALVLKECGEWLHVRVVPDIMVDMIIAQNGEEQAKEMLMFWVRKDMVRPDR